MERVLWKITGNSPVHIVSGQKHTQNLPRTEETIEESITLDEENEAIKI